MLSTREIVAWITCLVIAAGFVGAVYLVNSDLTADVPPAANPAESGVPPAAKPTESAALPAAKPAESAALPAAKPAENAEPPAATMQLGAEDPKVASAGIPAQQQQFLSIISDFAQKYETAPNDRAKDALRQQRAQAICGILNDLTVTNWVGTVNTLPGTDQRRGVLAVSLDKRSTIGTWDKKNNTLLKPRAAVHDAAIQLSPGQAIVFSGRFFRAKGNCIAERSPTLREAMTQPNWIMRFSAIKPADNAVPPAAKPAESAALPAAKREDAALPAAERAEDALPAARPAEEAALSAAKPADNALPPAAERAEEATLSAAKSAENAAPPAAERAEDAALPAAKPAEEAALSAAKPAENALPPTAERAEDALPAARPAEEAALSAAKPAENALPPTAERAEDAALPAAKPAEEATSAAKPADNALQPAAERAENAALPAARPAENAAPPAAERAEEAALSAAKPAENAVPLAATMQLGADLYEEDPKPTGKLYIGSLHWHAEQVAGAAGEPPDLAARADIEIPELKLNVMVSIRSNSDATLRASPRFEIHFIVPSDFVHQGVNSIPGILMSGHIPLALSAVKLTNNRFELDLGRLGLDRNLQLLKERTWFYIPLVYNDGGRALLSIAKDTLGERAFSDAHIIPAER